MDLCLQESMNLMALATMLGQLLCWWKFAYVQGGMRIAYDTNSYHFFFSNATLGNPFSSFLREGFMGVYELRRFNWSRTSRENPYTSSNKRPTHANVKDWMESCFCYALVRDLLVTSLDHAPMVLFTYREKKSYPMLFKIVEIWTTDKNSSVVVTDALDRSSWFFSLQIILDQSMNQRWSSGGARILV